MLDMFAAAYAKNPKLINLLLDKDIAKWMLAREANTRTVAALAMRAGYPSGGIMSSIAYFDAYRSEKLPINLVQAQRDFFGAHTYERLDGSGTFYHTEWTVGKFEHLP
jgi:6-phosphogluconate dehydrogenase